LGLAAADIESPKGPEVSQAVLQSFCRIGGASGGHDPYKSTADRHRVERKRESDKKLDADRQKLKEV
jgi:hypothetical protein